MATTTPIPIPSDDACRRALEALGHPGRLAIVRVLADGGAGREALRAGGTRADVRRRVSGHLATLRAAGLVRVESDGEIRLNADALRAVAAGLEGLAIAAEAEAEAAGRGAGG